MESFINRTKKISSFIFEASSPRLSRPSPRTWRKEVKNFKRLSCTSWDEVETSQMQKISLPKDPFKIVLLPSENQPCSCRLTWHVSPCIKVPGRTRRCKIVQADKARREFSANITCFGDEVLIWGNIKDNHEEGEDFQLVLKTPLKNMFRNALQPLLLLQGELKRGNRKKEQEFVLTHDALIFS